MPRRCSHVARVNTNNSTHNKIRIEWIQHLIFQRTFASAALRAPSSHLLTASEWEYPLAIQKFVCWAH